MGQNCCAISRLYIHESIHEKLIFKLISKTCQLKIGNPFDEQTEFGPLIDQVAYKNVVNFIQKAKEDGYNPILQGAESSKCMVYPTCFRDVEDDHFLATKEIFGPVLSIMKPFSTIDQVIDRVNRNPYGLSCGIFTNNQTLLSKCTNQIDTGMIWQNKYNMCPPWLPFGGFKQSGIGKELGIESLYSFTTLKAVY
jgi:acyl-CoA reductase-like NAD-dependent aldehyde dehydrogenase